MSTDAKPGQEPIFTITLQRPIMAHGESLTTLSFRTPIGADLMRYGNPVKYRPGMKFDDITFDEMKLAAMIAGLAGINGRAVEQMTTQDILDCGWALAPFFIPGVSTNSSSAPST